MTHPEQGTVPEPVAVPVTCTYCYGHGGHPESDNGCGYCPVCNGHGWHSAPLVPTSREARVLEAGRLFLNWRIGTAAGKSVSELNELWWAAEASVANYLGVTAGLPVRALDAATSTPQEGKP